MMHVSRSNFSSASSHMCSVGEAEGSVHQHFSCSNSLPALTLDEIADKDAKKGSRPPISRSSWATGAQHLTAPILSLGTSACLSLWKRLCAPSDG